MVIPHLPRSSTLPVNPDQRGKVPARWATMKEKVHHLMVLRRWPPAIRRYG